MVDILGYGVYQQVLLVCKVNSDILLPNKLSLGSGIMFDGLPFVASDLPFLRNFHPRDLV